MAVAPKAQLGGNVRTSSGTTLVLSITAAVGDFVVVRVAADNLSATTPTFTCAGGGNTWTTRIQGAVNATAAAGVAGAIITSKITTAMTASNITVTQSGASAHAAMTVESFTGVEDTVRSTAVSATGAVAAAAAPASGTVNAGDLVLGAIANETRAAIPGDTDTLNGAWSAAFRQQSATSGSDASCVTVVGQYKIPTASGAQTYNATVTASEWVAMCLVMQATPDPTVTQAAYQFFDDAGTESGAASLAALNTAVTGNLSAGDGFGVLRVRLQSTNIASLPATDDWQLQWEKNASGSWNNVVATGVEAISVQNPTLTSSGTYGANDSIPAISFLGDGKRLTKAGFYQAAGAAGPTGPINYVLLQASGTPPTTPPTILATSTTIQAEARGVNAFLDLAFDGSFQLVNGTTYFIGEDMRGVVQAMNLGVAGNASAPSPGNHYYYRTSTSDWAFNGAVDLLYRVYTADPVGTCVPYDNPNLTDGAATTNRLGAGTGSFVAGKITETGDAPNMGWTANNYTELVYSLKLLAADLAASDTLRFRVVRNGSTTGMTYTQTPTINIAVGPGPKPLNGASAGVGGITADLAIKSPIALAGTSSATSTITAALTVTAPPTPAAIGTRALETTEQRRLEDGSNRDLESAPGPVPIAASAAGGTQLVTGSLSIVIPLAASASGVSTTAGAFLAGRGLASTASVGTSTTTAAMAVARALAATTSAGTSTSTGTLGKVVPIVASAAGTSTATGDLTAVRAGVDLAGSAGGTSTITGSVGVGFALAGASTASSTATATTLPVARALGGSSGATSTAAATVLAKAIPVAGLAAVGLSTTSATLITVVGVAGSATGVSTAAGSFVVDRPLTASTVVGTSTVTGALAVARPLAANVPGVATATAGITVAEALIASSSGVSSTTGDFVIARALIASSDGVSTTSANMVASAAGGLSALVLGTSTATGSLGVARPLAGSSSGLSATSAAIAKTIQLTASAGGLSSTAVAIAVARPLTGSAAGVSTTTGNFIRSVAFVGSSAGIAIPTASLARAVPLTGIPIAGLSTVTATTQIARALIGSATGLSTATAATRVALALAGASNGLSVALADFPALAVALAGSTNGVSMTVPAELIFIIPTHGIWNGEVFEAMQYGDKQVIDWMMITS